MKTVLKNILLHIKRSPHTHTQNNLEVPCKCIVLTFSYLEGNGCKGGGQNKYQKKQYDTLSAKNKMNNEHNIVADIFTNP